MAQGSTLFEAAAEYWRDAAQRGVLFVETLNERGNTYVAQSAKTAPHVLTFPVEILRDGRTLERPANYALVRIDPPKDVTIDPMKPPIVVVDPRAGHGPGIGGMKPESEIGVALRAGHPVYFIGFLPKPEPGQTIEDVCRAEGTFIEDALPRWFADAGVRRYGFHGLSYEFLVARFGELAPTLANARIVIAHLGNGASMCAVKDGRSVATTMGFTAVDGLMMGTRCGAIDPGVILYMMQEHGMDAAAIEDLIYRQSGVLGVSGVSSDMRALRTSAEPAASEAIALFVYRIVRELGSLVAALGGIDALVFSGGIGEHDAMTRGEVVNGSRWIGAVLDPNRNSRGDFRISARQLGCFGLGSPDRRGAAHRAPNGDGFVVRSRTARGPLQPLTPKAFFLLARGDLTTNPWGSSWQLRPKGFEPLRLCRRPFCLSHAAMGLSFCLAK